MRKNLVLIDFIQILSCDNNIINIIQNDKNNDYIFITEYNIEYIKKYLSKIRVLGIYTEFGSYYYSYSEEKNDYILEYTKKRGKGIHYEFDILIKAIYSYISTLPYILPDKMIYKARYYYYISFVGSVQNYSYFLSKYFTIEKYKDELKNKLQHLIKVYDLNLSLLDNGTLGFYILPEKCNKVQVVDHLPSNYYEIFFTGKRNDMNRNIMNHGRIHDIEINNEDELKYFLETL